MLPPGAEHGSDAASNNKVNETVQDWMSFNVLMDLFPFQKKSCILFIVLQHLKKTKTRQIIFLLTSNTLSLWALRRSRTSLHGYKTKRREVFPSGLSKASSPRSPVWSQVSALMRGRALPPFTRHVCGRVCVTVHPARVAWRKRKHRGPPQLSR